MIFNKQIVKKKTMMCSRKRCDFNQSLLYPDGEGGRLLKVRNITILNIYINVPTLMESIVHNFVLKKGRFQTIARRNRILYRWSMEVPIYSYIVYLSIM